MDLNRATKKKILSFSQPKQLDQAFLEYYVATLLLEFLGGYVILGSLSWNHRKEIAMGCWTSMTLPNQASSGNLGQMDIKGTIESGDFFFPYSIGWQGQNGDLSIIRGNGRSSCLMSLVTSSLKGTIQVFSIVSTWEHWSQAS